MSSQVVTSDLLTSASLVPRDDFAHVHGQTDVPLSNATVGEFLLDTADRYADRCAVVFREQGIRRTWRELAQEVDAVASGLHALGIGKGDRVGIWSPNRFEWVLTQFATARIGAILVNINPAYRLAEVEYALRKVGCKALVVAEAFRASRYLEMLRELAPELESSKPNELRAQRLPELRIIVRMGDAKTPGMLNFPEVVSYGQRLFDPEKLAAVNMTLNSDDPINIQFTSGTTGSPKGATLTHHNIVNNARFFSMGLRLTERDSLCIPLPLYHCFGMVAGVLACVESGSTMVFPGEAFDAGDTLAAIHEERCTALHGVPTMFIAELDHPDLSKYDLSQLRTGVMAGSPCPVETMKRVVSQMNLRELTTAYGMTETSPASFQCPPSDPLVLRTSTVGRVLPHLEVKIVDSSGDTVRVGETGELCAKGYAVMKGYWGDDAKTRESIVDGWFRTGDLATIDSDGYCKIVGRLKDMLIRGGENVYPREIEEFLFRHPKVQSVQVFGVPDEKYGEEVCAWIILRPGEQATPEEISDFCRNQIAHNKVPRYIRFVSEMPMTVTGKVQKFALRELMIDELRASRPNVS
ncbi:AMP-binding protein [Paraburkholderia sp. MPAMCS5]|uniref:AMP-binding protein n=1 Tax=Paraburkholderia sp. MPAMCS5 TaxID=3112563 RepID=UPI002E189354|nr:AMP-binding protein [Paraburkholderia sp. MPAMCS5]